MALIKKPYEISVWQDIIMYVGTPVSGKTSPTKNINDLSLVDYQYYDEQRLATIGSHTMTTPMRAINPTLTRNINGVETLKFEMYYQYIDPNTGEREHNPLIDYLVNERKIKLYYEDDDPNHPDHWYDFIIKKDEEKARDNKYSFTCNSLGAAELGKTGFKVELDVELENNMGTVQQLAEKILENSDWQLSQTQDIIKQTVNEPLYKIYLNEDITTAHYTQTRSVAPTIPSGAVIYVYYTPYANKETDYFQFIYIVNESEVEVLSDRMTLVCDDINVLDLYLENVQWNDNKPSFQNGGELVANYRGDRYVRKQKTTYDSILKKTVKIYQDNSEPSKEVYGYQTTKYYGVNTVINYIHNSVNFGGASYWYGFGDDTSIQRIIYPPASDGIEDRISYLSMKIGAPVYRDGQIDYINSPRIMNDGIIYNYSKIKTFDKNDTYLLRMKVKKMNANGTLGSYLTNSSNFPFTCQVRKYEKVDQNTGTRCFNFLGSNASPDSDDSDYALIEAKCETSASIEELKNNIGIFFFRSANYDLNENESYYIEEVQLTQGIWAEATDTEPAHWIKIGEVPTVKSAIINHFYYPEENIGLTNPDDYVYISEDPDDSQHPVIFTPLYGEGENQFEKIRSISAKESNRFNLLQQLCETFECWVKFHIDHEQNGRIKVINYYYYQPITLLEEQFIPNTYYLYDNSIKQYILALEYNDKKQYFNRIIRKRQDKEVIFYGEILEDNPLGFKYGINLKDVIRTLDSEQIATKIIVKNNSNEYADNGFCSIARAKDNPTKENFLYNFDYYIKQGILNESILNNDLYLRDNIGSIGLYPNLANYNSQRNQIITDYTNLANEITEIKSDVEANTQVYNSASEELSKLIDPVSGKLVRYTGYIYEDFYDQVARAYKEDNANHIVPAYADQIYYAPDGVQDLTITAYDNSNTELSGISYYKKITFRNAIKGSYIKTNNPYKNDVVNGHFDGQKALKYYIKNSNYERCKNNDVIQDNKYYIYLGESDKIPFYIKGSTNTFVQATTYLAANGTTYYWYYNTPVNEVTYFQTPANTAKLKFIKTNNTISTTYIYGAYQRVGVASDDDTVNDTSTINYLEQITTLKKNKADAEVAMEEKEALLEEYQAKYDDYTEQLKDIAKATEEIELQFITKYSRYIQEGSWHDDNYIDDDLYYLDAVQVLYQSAYPKVSYNISVLELSALDGYEPYKFGLAHKTFIEDTEFFGWVNKALNIPARERIVVTELSNSLDEPEKNTIKVQNYKNHFEDLFQRITAATQNLEYHSGDYARAADAITMDGAVDQSVMQKTMVAAQFVIQNAENQSVVIDNTGLLATKLDDPGQRVLLTSGGLLVSVDGGQHYGVAITGYGINADYLRAGIIDTEKINILAGSYPTFRWDAHGIHAYAYTEKDGTITSYNTSNYVTLDRFGLYGINGITSFVPNKVTDVEKKANFALTWNGLFIRSNYRRGYVSISPNDDIALYSYGSQGFSSIGEANALDELYYLDNRNAFYYIDNGEYIKCTTESLSSLGNTTLYISGYEPVQSQSSASNYYYLYGGEFIQCIGNDPEVLTNSKFYQISNGIPGATAIKRGKFGMIGVDGNNNELYGLALYNEAGEPTVLTQSDGTLWLQDAMRIGDESNQNGQPRIYLGRGEDAGANLWKVMRVYNTTDQADRFVLYSDGTLNASGVSIEGTINATGGTIGGLSIDELVLSVGVSIEQLSGNIFNKDINDNITPSSLRFKYKTSLAENKILSEDWFISKDNQNWTLLSHKTSNFNQELTVYYNSSYFENTISYLKIELTDINSRIYNDILNLKLTSDSDKYRVIISENNIYKFPDSLENNDPVWTLSVDEFDIYVQNVQTNEYIPFVYTEVTIDQTTFDLDKTRYYYYDSEIQKYKRCNLNDIFDSSTQYYTCNINISTSTRYVNIDTDKYIIQATNESNKVSYDIENFYEERNLGEEYTHFWETVRGNEYIRFTVTLYIDNSVYNLSDTVNITIGTTESMATFAVHANSINAAIGSTSLEFGSNGLTINNGGLTVNTNLNGYNKVTVSEADFNNDKTSYYYYDNVLDSFIACTNESVYDTSIQYYKNFNNEKTTVLDFDNDTGNFSIKGIVYADGGYFSGTIHARDGEFSGVLKSASGEIGGFIIGENSLTTEGLTLHSATNDTASYIEVEKIIIGRDAQIKEFLKLGNLTLWNPNQQAANNLVLQLSQDGNNYFTLDNDGNIRGLNWHIAENGNGDIEAEFDLLRVNDGYFKGQIEARDGYFEGLITASVLNADTINTVHFNSERVRAMGGAFIFRPSIPIKFNDDDNSTVTRYLRAIVTNNEYFYYFGYNTQTQSYEAVGEIVLLAGETIKANDTGKTSRYGKIHAITEQVQEDDKTILIVTIDMGDNTTQIPYEDYSYYQNLILFGKPEEDVIIGINSDNQQATEFLPYHSLSMAEFSDLQGTVFNQTKLNPNYRLILGDLSALKNNNISGYGLYADNVFLRGSLTTANVENNSVYAGINTQRHINFDYATWSKAPLNNPDDEKIVFWGGASGMSDNSIQKSPFIVTDKGNIYARSGEFKGTVITDSLITNTVIKAPVIYGNNKRNEVSLKIVDTTESDNPTKFGGIGFYELVDEPDLYITVNITATEFNANKTKYWYNSADAGEPPVWKQSTNNDTYTSTRDYYVRNDKLTVLLTNNGFYHFHNTVNGNTPKIGSDLWGQRYKFINFVNNDNKVEFLPHEVILGETHLIDGIFSKQNASLTFYQNGDDNIKLRFGDISALEVNNTGIIGQGNKQILQNEIAFISTTQTSKLEYKINDDNYYCLYVTE